MTTLLAQPELPAAHPDHFLLRDVDWDFYESLLRQIGDRHIYVTFDGCDLELMSPLPEHERWKGIIGYLVRTLALERNIPIAGLGSTTFRRKDIAKGLEPDECFYIRNEPAVRGRNRLDLAHDPPPDLVVEIDITHRDLDRPAIYAAMGVAELWRFDGEHLTGFILDPAGHYRPTTTSVALAPLRLADLEQFLAMLAHTDETTVMRAILDWLRQTPA